MEYIEEVNYYVVREGTQLHTDITKLHERRENFVKDTKSLIKKYKADSIARTVLDGRPSLYAMLFTYENAPLNLNWDINEFGNFVPRNKSKIQKEFLALADTSLTPVDNFRVGKLKNKLVLAIERKAKGKIPNIEDVDLATQKQIEFLKSEASEKEVRHFDTLTQELNYVPLPLFETDLFNISLEAEEFRKKLATTGYGVETPETLKEKFKHASIYSRPAIAVRRALNLKQPAKN